VIIYLVQLYITNKWKFEIYYVHSFTSSTQRVFNTTLWTFNTAIIQLGPWTIFSVHVFHNAWPATAIILTFESDDFVNSIMLSTNHRWHSNGSHLNPWLLQSNPWNGLITTDSSLKAMPWFNLKNVFCTVHFFHCTTYYTYNTGINSHSFTIINKLGTNDAPPWGEQICWM
jgi:hypothetical protein